MGKQIKKQKVVVVPFNPNEISVSSIKNHLILYIEFFDDFINKFLPYSRVNPIIKQGVEMAGEARILAGTALYGKGVNMHGYELEEEDYFNINKTFNNINQLQKTL